jgi:D-xylose 1-dehydrogenase (NADP+, D-xylono-1,5-lactone-forming)
MSLRWGLLSTAKINGALLDSGHGGIVAVASRSADRAEAYAREHGIERAHGSYEDLLADPEVDVIYNPLPNSMHVEWSIRALEAGKHVLCEKPMSRRPADVDRLFDVAEREGRVVAEAFMYRHNPQIARAREIVASGAIGPLRVLRACFSYAHPDPADVRLFADLDGGGLMDVGCYCVSGVRTLAGAEPERVYAEQVTGGEGVDVRLVGTLRFPGDVLAVIDCGLSYAAHDELEAIGEDGSVFLDDPWHGRDTVVEVRRPGEATERIEVPWASSYALEMEDLEAAARGEREPLLGRADALAQARTIAALYRAADEGRPVAPDSET